MVVRQPGLLKQIAVEIENLELDVFSNKTLDESWPGEVIFM